MVTKEASSTKMQVDTKESRQTHAVQLTVTIHFVKMVPRTFVVCSQAPIGLGGVKFADLMY